MKKFTLDTNCIIDLEEKRADSVHLEKIVSAWKKGQIELSVVAVSASENQQSKVASQSYADFEQKISNAGLIGIQKLLPIMTWDVGYWDHMVWSSDELDKEAATIRDILFPNVQPNPPENIQENSKWRNQMCDTLVAWAHAHNQWDYLVTRDQNYHAKNESLKSVGVQEIVTPEQASKLLV